MNSNINITLLFNSFHEKQIQNKKYFQSLNNWKIVNNYIKFMDIKCADNCSVMFLSQLYVCKELDCAAPAIRCKDCFRYFHTSFDENKNKKVHEYDKFDESPLIYRNFRNLIKLHEIIERKVRSSFGIAITNVEFISWASFTSIVEFQDIFYDNSLVAEFCILKELYYKRKATFSASPSSEISARLAMFNDKLYHSLIEKLTAPSNNQAILANSIEHSCGNKVSKVEQFIGIEQQAFYQHCQELREKQISLDIVAYLSNRRKNHNVDRMYFNRDFENFMENLYELKADEKGIFSPSEYSLHVWANLSIHFLDPNVAAYFDHWVEAFKYYVQMLTVEGKIHEQLEIACFRMWKEQFYAYKGLEMKNIYFLETFILGYLQYLIHNENYEWEKVKVENWKGFGEFLKDYTQVVVLKQEEYLNMAHYRLYIKFRKDQVTINFLEKIKNDPEIVYNRAYAVEYLNTLFCKDGRIALKSYKKFLSQKNEEEVKKNQQINRQSDVLKEEMEKEEGDKFYLNVFNAFVNEAVAEQMEINRENYVLYKAHVLQKVDENVIRMENQELEEELSVLEKMKKEQEENTKLQNQEKNEKIKYSIDPAQELILFNGQESSQEEQQGFENCPCCAGSPEDCKEPDCQMMGLCITCSL